MTSETNTDISIPFVLPEINLRGRLSRLEHVNEVVLKQHDYPENLEQILSELLAASAVLSGLLKYEGVFTLQTKTSGAVKMVVIDITHRGEMRGYAQFNTQAVENKKGFQSLMGEGYLAFTVDQGLKVDRYQGIVTLNQQTLSDALEHYFDQSEQLKTRILIMSEQNQENIWKSSALLLQQMPTHEMSDDAWAYVDAILGTLNPKEFLDFEMPYERLLTNLFHEGGISLFPPLTLIEKCRCSEERIKSFLQTLTEDELETLLENRQLKMTCEFCNHNYIFDRKDLMTVH